jgi:hypothetical protein
VAVKAGKFTFDCCHQSRLALRSQAFYQGAATKWGQRLLKARLDNLHNPLIDELARSVCQGMKDARIFFRFHPTHKVCQTGFGI